MRRDDVAWGKTFDDLRRANGDTYHVTQLFAANRDLQPLRVRRGQLGDFENVVLSQAASERLCVSPDLLLTTRTTHSSTRRGALAHTRKNSVQIWKVVVARRGRSCGFALMLEQNLDDMPKAPEEDAEFVVPDEFTKSVVPLKDIEAWTGPSSTQRCMPSINIIPRATGRG